MRGRKTKGNKKPGGGLHRCGPSLGDHETSSQTTKKLRHLLWNERHGVAEVLETSDMVTLDAFLVLLIKKIYL